MPGSDPAKEEAILQATLDVFEERGLAGLSMASVAKAAGVATGTIYTYFDDKAALVRAVHTRIRQRSAATIRAAQPRRDRYPERLQAYVEAYFDDTLTHERELDFADQFKRSPYVRPEDHTATLEAYKFLFDLVEEGVSAGFLSDADPQVHLYAMDAIVRGMVSYHSSNGGDVATARHNAWTYAWRAIKA